MNKTSELVVKKVRHYESKVFFSFFFPLPRFSKHCVASWGSEEGKKGYIKTKKANKKIENRRQGKRQGEGKEKGEGRGGEDWQYSVVITCVSHVVKLGMRIVDGLLL